MKRDITQRNIERELRRANERASERGSDSGDPGIGPTAAVAMLLGTIWFALHAFWGAVPEYISPWGFEFWGGSFLGHLLTMFVASAMMVWGYWIAAYVAAKSGYDGSAAGACAVLLVLVVQLVAIVIILGGQPASAASVAETPGQTVRSANGAVPLSGGAVAPKSHCGSSAGAAPDGVGDQWSNYSCRARREAHGAWRKCLRRSDYTGQVGRGCPGKERCCPPE